MRHTPQDQRSGVTLVEVAVSTVLVGVVLVAALETVGSSMRAARLGSESTDGHAIAERLMAEVLAHPYEDPDGNTNSIGPEDDETLAIAERLNYDDVDDYHGWVQNGFSRRDGFAISELAGWQCRVEVVYAAAEPSAATLVDVGDDQGVKRVTVRCISPTGVETTLTALRTHYGPLEGTTPLDASRSTAIGVEISTSGQSLTKAAALVNAPEAPE